MAVLRAPDLEPGYQLYQNAWTGFAVMYPQGWSSRSSKGSGVGFVSADSQAELELSLLAAGLMLTASQHVELFMRSLPHHQAELLEDSGDHYARATFEGPQWQGLLSVHLTPQGGTLGIARRRPDSDHGLETPFAKMLSSLSPIAPIARERWLDPTEESFHIDCPAGWQRQAAIRPPAGGMGARQPACRLACDPQGAVFLAVDPEYRDFIHGPLPGPPPAEEGFFQKLGRYAREMENAMTASMGGIVCPFEGLRPAVDVFFWPHWQRQFPGCRMIGYESFGAPDSAYVRLMLPGDVVRVYRMVGLPIPLPATMGPPRWLGGHEYYYQAPAKLMEKFEPIFQGVAASFEISPRWRQREQGMAQAQFQQASLARQQSDAQWAAHSQSLHQQRMHDIAMQGQAAQQAHLNQQSISDMQMQGWGSTQRSSDYVQHGSVNAVNERTDFFNADSGAVHNLSIHYENYWDTGRDLIVGSNVALQPPPEWTPLQPWQGRPS